VNGTWNRAASITNIESNHLNGTTLIVSGFVIRLIMFESDELFGGEIKIETMKIRT